MSLNEQVKRIQDSTEKAFVEKHIPDLRTLASVTLRAITDLSVCEEYSGSQKAIAISGLEKIVQKCDRLAVLHAPQVNVYQPESVPTPLGSPNVMRSD